MEVIVTYRHLDSSPGLQTHIEEKLSHLKKFFIKPIQAHVILNVEGPRHIAEITLTEDHNAFSARDEGYNMYDSLDRAIEKMKHQLTKHKERKKNHHIHTAA